MICSKCGQLNADDAQFCTNCAWNLQIKVEREQLKCPNCGQLNDLNVVFCAKCGRKILRHGHIAIFWLLGFFIWVLASIVITIAINFADKPLEKVLAYLPVFIGVFIVLFIPGIIMQFYTFRLKKYRLEHALKKINLFRLVSTLLAILITLNFLSFFFGLYSLFCNSKNPAECSQTFGCSFLTSFEECQKTFCVLSNFGQEGNCFPSIWSNQAGSAVLGIILIIIIILNLLIIPVSLLIYYITGFQENKPANTSNAVNVLGIIFTIILMLLIIFVVILAMFNRI